MKIMFFLTFLLAVGCAVPAYQRAGANGTHRTGYSEVRLSDNSYRVTYLDAKMDTVYINFMRRASELTLENGYKYFETKDEGATKENSHLVSLTYGHAVDMALPRREATVVFMKDKTPNSTDAEAFLKNNPIPKDVKR